MIILEANDQVKRHVEAVIIFRTALRDNQTKIIILTQTCHLEVRRGVSIMTVQMLKKDQFLHNEFHCVRPELVVFNNEIVVCN